MPCKLFDQIPQEWRTQASWGMMPPAYRTAFPLKEHQQAVLRKKQLVVTSEDDGIGFMATLDVRPAVRSFHMLISNVLGHFWTPPAAVDMAEKAARQAKADIWNLLMRLLVQNAGRIRGAYLYDKPASCSSGRLATLYSEDKLVCFFKDCEDVFVARQVHVFF